MIIFQLVSYDKSSWRYKSLSTFCVGGCLFVCRTTIACLLFAIRGFCGKNKIEDKSKQRIEFCFEIPLNLSSPRMTFEIRQLPESLRCSSFLPSFSIRLWVVEEYQWQRWEKIFGTWTKEFPRVLNYWRGSNFIESIFGGGLNDTRRHKVNRRRNGTWTRGSTTVLGRPQSVVR